MRRRDFLHQSLTAGTGAVSWVLLPPMCARAADRDLVEVTLEAGPYRYPGTSGAEFTGLAYNGRVPGPLLRVRHGQTFRARYINRTGGPSAIHWHGMILPNDMDGVPYVTQPPVPDGAEFLYTYKPDPPGLPGITPMSVTRTRWVCSARSWSRIRAIRAPMSRRCWCCTTCPTCAACGPRSPGTVARR